MQVVWIKNAIVLCLIVERCNGNHFKGPVNTTVAEGTRATLECQTSPSKTVWWKYFQKELFYANTISHDYKSSHEAEVDASQGIYNLIILNASSHAGLYTCLDDDGEGEKTSAWLTVTANETPDPSTENKTQIVAIAVVSVCLVIIVIAIVLAILCIRCHKRRQHKASEDNVKPTVENEEAKALMNTEKPSEGQTNSDHAIGILNENIPDPTPEPQEVRTEDLAVSTVGLEKTHQKDPPDCSTPTEMEETESPPTSSCVASNSQAVSSVSSPQKEREKSTPFGPQLQYWKQKEEQDKTAAFSKLGPVAKPRMRNEPETPLVSTTPVEKEESGNDNANTTKLESTIENTNTTNNAGTDPLKPDTQKDERPKVPPTVPPKPKADESIVVPEENSQKNEAIASPGKQDSGAKEKPPLKPKPSMTSADTANVRTKSTTNSGGINRASDAEQGKADSSPKQNEEGIPHQEDIVNTEERDLPTQSVTEGDDKKEISFKK